MPRPLTLLLPLVVGLLATAAATVWAMPPAAAAQPTPTTTSPPPPSTTTPPASATTARPGQPVPPTTGLGPVVPFPPPPPSVFDVAGRIRQAVNRWLRDLVAAAIDPAVDLAARSVLATPDLAAPGGRVRELWGLSLGLANTGYVLLVSTGGVLLLTNETLQTRYTLKEVAPRLVVGMVASNTSLLLVGFGTDLANALSRALLGPGVDPDGVRATLKAVLVFPLNDAEVLLTLVALVVVVLAL